MAKGARMELPSEMRVIEIAGPGGPEVLRPSVRRLPQPAAGEILIRVRAAGVNRPDLMQRAGRYAPPPGASDLPGLEAAGEVVAVGPGGGSPWRVGDRVCALLPGGGYAQFALAPAAHALPVPEALDMAAAGALPETVFTVWGNLFMRGRLAAGESVLVHGGSSGIGTTAIQIARARGVRVFVTAGSEAKCQACLDLGAEMAVNYRKADFVAAVRDATGGRGVDVVLDMVGGDYLARDVAALAPEGRLVMIAHQAGAEARLDFGEVMRKRLTVTGTTLRPQSVEAKAGIAASLCSEVWPLVEAGRIAPVIEARLPLEAAAEAHARLEAGEVIGKIVLEVA